MSSYKAYTDEQLLEIYQQNYDNSIIGELFKRYSLMLYGICFKYFKDDALAKDTISEILELLLEKTKGQQIVFFKSWLYTVSKNHIFKKIKTNNGLKTIDIENISGKFMENQPELTLINNEEKSELLQKALSNLNEEQHTCIELFYYQQKSYQEVASITGYELNKVKSAIQNGKRNLKIFMEENQQHDE
jgi:RNA polymerase sigma factor (sigma-70 family)